MRTIAIVNQKGGCGKTMTAINLADLLARAARRVLLVDMDPQGHATLGLVKDTSPLRKTIYDVLIRDPEAGTLSDILIRVRENLDLAPSDILLAALPEKLSGIHGKENRLSEILEGIRSRYDYIIVDCPPNVGMLTFNALKACSEAIIPVEPSFFSLHGVAKQVETLDLLARRFGHEIEARALITLFSARSEYAKTVVDEIRSHLAERTYKTVIRYSVKLSEAVGRGVPISELAPRSAGCEDYQGLTREVLALETAAMAVAAAAGAERVEVPQVARPVPETLAPMSRIAAGISASPPVRVGESVVFTLAAPDARCVQLAGDFNGWIAEGNEMQSSGQVWTKTVQLPPGRYHYRFVVDGGWMTDPMNVHVEATPWGGYNSVYSEGNGDQASGASES